MDYSELEYQDSEEFFISWFEKRGAELNEIFDDMLDFMENRMGVVTGISFDESKKKKIKQLILRYGAKEVAESMFISIDQYFRPGETDEQWEESLEKTFDYIGRICFTRSQSYKCGGLWGPVNYILKIAKNNMSYVNEKLIKKFLFKYMTLDNMEEIKNIVANSKNWTKLKQRLRLELGIDLDRF